MYGSVLALSMVQFHILYGPLSTRELKKYLPYDLTTLCGTTALHTPYGPTIWPSIALSCGLPSLYRTTINWRLYDLFLHPTVRLSSIPYDLAIIYDIFRRSHRTTIKYTIRPWYHLFAVTVRCQYHFSLYRAQPAITVHIAYRVVLFELHPISVQRSVTLQWYQSFDPTSL